jgi:hypothetical protein
MSLNMQGNAREGVSAILGGPQLKLVLFCNVDRLLELQCSGKMHDTSLAA